uniref:Integrase catalytic domain-containing protein n=1 Tax=Tanacetum cinerariifolium TaxID=118510 RepID=A0A699H9J9_TANCI|nr:hypothetical protein [Tanacetum cinerariifolium]GEX78059.1 hypothetical protein [Tanacetum cinerariifolium]
MEWYRNLWIVLSTEDKLPFLEQPIPTLPVPPAGQANPLDDVTTHQAWVKTQKEIAGLMLMIVDPDIQKNLEHLGAYDMLKELKTLYVQKEDQELLQTVREFHACKQEEGQSISSYVLKMKSYIDNLDHLGHAMTQNLSVSLILVSLRKEYDGFVQKYNMHNMGKTVTEARRIQKNQKKKSHKAGKGNQGKGKAKMGYAPVQVPTFAPKPKNPLIPKKDNHAKDAICHQCGEGLRGSRKLKPGALSLYVGDGHRAGVEAIREFHFNKRAKLNLDSTLLWHCRLGHINKRRIEKLQYDGLLDSNDIKSFEKCVACMSEKMARKPYSHQVERAKYLLGLIHTDVCGSFKIMSRQGAYYFVTFTNDFSRYRYVYLLKHKHEVFETFKVFQKEVENQLGKTIKSLRSDRAHRTPPYMPQHNGVSEKRNRTLLDMGCEALVKRDTLTKPDKLEPRAFKCIFVGYPKETMGYSFYYSAENKVFVTRNVAFFENDVIDHEASGSLEDLAIVQEEDAHPSIDISLNHEEDDQIIDEPQSDINPIRRSTRTRRAPDRMCLYIDVEEHELGDLGEPTNYKAASLDPESDKWLKVMNVEMQSMKDNEVWKLVDLPPGGKTVGHKWLFKKKTDMNGAVHTYKARLVAKGFTQTSRIDYE